MGLLGDRPHAQKSLYLMRTMNTQAETLQICREITNFRDFNPKSPGIYISFLKDSITEVLLSQGNITAIIKSFNTYINVNS